MERPATPIDESTTLQASPYAAKGRRTSYHRAFNLPSYFGRSIRGPRPLQGGDSTILLAWRCHFHRQRTPVRDMVFVQDTVAGFKSVAESAAWSVGAGVGVSVGELIERILIIVGERCRL